MRLIDLLVETGADKDPVSTVIAVGASWLMRWLAAENAANMARHLAEAYKPEGVP